MRRRRVAQPEDWTPRDSIPLWERQFRDVAEMNVHRRRGQVIDRDDVDLVAETRVGETRGGRPTRLQLDVDRRERISTALRVGHRRCRRDVLEIGEIRLERFTAALAEVERGVLVVSGEWCNV